MFPPPVAQVLSVQFLLTIASYFIIRKIFVRTEFGAFGGGGREGGVLINFYREYTYIGREQLEFDGVQTGADVARFPPMLLD